MSSLSTVLGTGRHSVDLDDGRQVAPGATVENVDTSHPHNRGLVLDGHIKVVEGSTPRTRKDAERVAAAEKAAAEAAEAEAAAAAAAADGNQGGNG